jgi:3-methyladenine DNA glycosylase AlkD
MAEQAADATAAAIDAEITALPDRTVAAARSVRRAWSARLRRRSGPAVLAVAEALVPRQRWVAYELVEHHPAAVALLDDPTVTRLGQGMASWAEVDAFGRHLAGLAWQRGLVSDATVERWAASPDRWWRRAALVSTVPLNLRAAGGTGDTGRTLRICAALVHDRDPMVTRALSWALRQLTVWDPDAVADFLVAHDDDLAALVRREVTTKLRTGRKAAPPRRHG